MNPEDRLIREIFGEKHPSWRGREVTWCPLCEVFIVACKKCSGTSCNCMACDECRQDQQDFNKLRPFPEAHLPKEDLAAVDRYKRIKHLLFTCLTENGTGINWEWLAFHGKLSPNDIDVFKLHHLPDMGVIDYQI